MKGRGRGFLGQTWNLALFRENFTSPLVKAILFGGFGVDDDDPSVLRRRPLEIFIYFFVRTSKNNRPGVFRREICTQLRARVYFCAFHNFAYLLVRNGVLVREGRKLSRVLCSHHLYVKCGPKHAKPRRRLFAHALMWKSTRSNDSSHTRLYRYSTLNVIKIPTK